MRQTTGLSDWCHIASRVAGKNTGSCGILTDWTGFLFHLTSFDISGVGNTPLAIQGIAAASVERSFLALSQYIYIYNYMHV